MAARNSAETANKVFDQALRARRDVTDSYYAGFGFDSDRTQSMINSELTLLDRVRAAMIAGQGGGRLFSLVDEANPHLDEASKLLNEGRVAAIDGTTALDNVELMNTTQYACAVGYVTSRTRGNPEIIITETSSAYIDAARINASSNQDLVDICNELDDARESASWPTTFREYEERRIALEKCSAAEVVFIDGPIFTQNLLTQQEGRNLLDRLIASSTKFIGIIKGLGSSWAMCRWCASALRTGEGYVLCPVGQPIRERAKSGAQSELMNWLPRTEEFVRVVYRPAEKAFAFECCQRDVGLACALLQLDQSPTLQHELPVLLETIDSQLRAGFDCGLARNSILNRIMRDKDGYRMAIDAINEREFR